MPLGIALSELRSELKAETYQSSLPANTAAMVDIYNNLLVRAQRELWNQYVWPHLLYNLDWPLIVGQRYYAFPLSMPFENVTRLWYSQPPQWFPLTYGISNSLYNYYGGETGRAFPPQRWQNVASVNPDDRDHLRRRPVGDLAGAAPGDPDAVRGHRTPEPDGGGLRHLPD
jgi:hypothetical protein